MALGSLLVEVFAGSRKARQLFVQDVLLGAHAVTFHVLCPVQLTHVKVKDLQEAEQALHFYRDRHCTRLSDCYDQMCFYQLKNVFLARQIPLYKDESKCFR